MTNFKDENAKNLRFFSRNNRRVLFLMNQNCYGDFFKDQKVDQQKLILRIFKDQQANKIDLRSIETFSMDQQVNNHGLKKKNK